MTDMQPVRRALLSVSDKTGLIDLARALDGYGVELLSTGGSAKALRDAGLPVRDVADVTGFPEMMDGRVKTLHPAVHGGLLALRDNGDHLAAMDKHGIGPIDLLVVNLYPFEETVAKGADYDTCIENIDIGGPAMIRAAAKNHAFVTVVVDVEDYDTLLGDMAQHDGATCPKQRAAFYLDGSDRPGVATAQQVQGKELSYNNINDTDAAFELVSEFAPADGPACAIIKHANPCGVARGDTLKDAYTRAFDCDRTSAFGGIIALNQMLDGATAQEIAQIFTEVVIAPAADDDARAVFAAKKNLRLLVTGDLADPTAPGRAYKQVAGGLLVQDKDTGAIGMDDLKVVTKKKPTEAEMADLLFAWTVAKHVKSNAIIYVKDGATVGVGAGQMSRVDSTRIAARKAQDMAEAMGLSAPLTNGSVVASDAFFPFSDGLLTAAEAGASAVIQPGGSMRDDEVIAAADKAGLAMVFTGMRHFRH